MASPDLRSSFTSKRSEFSAKLANAKGSNALGNLGAVITSPGEVHGAISFLERALAIHREIGDRQGEGRDLGNLGSAYSALGEREQTVEYYQQALVLARETADCRSEAIALWNMGLEFNRLADRAQAIANAKAALKIFEEIEDPNANKVRQQLAEWKRESPRPESSAVPRT